MALRSNGRPEPEVIMNVRHSCFWLENDCSPRSLLIPLGTTRTGLTTGSRMFLECDQFVDGFSYVKARLEEAYKPGGILEKPPAKASRDPALATLKREDVDLIVHEFEITRVQAEKALLENGGDVGRTIRALITPTLSDNTGTES